MENEGQFEEVKPVAKKSSRPRVSFSYGSPASEPTPSRSAGTPSEGRRRVPGPTRQVSEQADILEPFHDMTSEQISAHVDRVLGPEGKAIADEEAAHVAFRRSKSTEANAAVNTAAETGLGGYGGRMAPLTPKVDWKGRTRARIETPRGVEEGAVYAERKHGMDATEAGVLSDYNETLAAHHERKVKHAVTRAGLGALKIMMKSHETNGCSSPGCSGATRGDLAVRHPEVREVINQAQERARAEVGEFKPVDENEFRSNPNLMHVSRLHHIAKMVGEGTKPSEVADFARAGTLRASGVTGSTSTHKLKDSSSFNPPADWLWDVAETSSVEKVKGIFDIGRKAFSRAKNRGHAVSGIMGSEKSHPTPKDKEKAVSAYDAQTTAHQTAWQIAKSDILGHVKAARAAKKTNRGGAGVVSAVMSSATGNAEEGRRRPQRGAQGRAAARAQTVAQDVLETNNAAAEASGTIDPSSLPTTRVGITSGVVNSKPSQQKPKK
jgi:hypothetical protein